MSSSAIEATTEDLLRQRKLCVVLDLDHTLLHSRSAYSLNFDEFYLIGIQTQEASAAVSSSISAAAVVRGLHYPSVGEWITKLRPFVQTFLKETSSMYEMYVNTKGSRVYAANMVKLMDPNQEYFIPARVIAREDNPKDEKSLALVPRPENMVVIVDDTESIWPNNKDNLVVVDKYYFFNSTGFHKKYGEDQRSYSELRSDESESEGGLARTLEVLRRVHREFFTAYDHQQHGYVDDQKGVVVSGQCDVRELLKKIKPVPVFAPVSSGNSEDEIAEAAKASRKQDELMSAIREIKDNLENLNTRIQALCLKLTKAT